MNIKKYTLISLLGISPLAGGMKAQIFSKIPADIYTEIGVSGMSKKAFELYRGVNIGVKSGTNSFDTFFGAALNSDKKGCFTGMITEDFKWNRHSHFSTWSRAIFSFSKRVQNITAEFSPVRLNLSFKKFDFSFNPAFAVHRDFKNKGSAIGINTVFQSNYSVSPKDKLFGEVKYQSKPFNNIIYRVTYRRYF